MNIPLTWLRDYVTWDMPTQDLAERLTLGGLETKGVERVGEEWDPDNIRVGRVVSIRQHPNADRLVLVTVEYGADQPLEVVTGAPNLKVGDSGQKVVFATLGSRLIDPYAETRKYRTLKRTKIRGVPSTGMVCSEKELGISDEHTGIIILPDDAPVGLSFQEYWGDEVLDLDLTPNLARCFSMVGVARETAALTGGQLVPFEPTVQADGEPIEGRIDVEIADPDLCPRYSAALITGVTIGPSPLWMQRRLSLAGMRPINNIVDITNYVMLEMGQPLHAFDYRLIRPGEAGGTPTIIVRRAHDGEEMPTLDGVEHTYTNDMLMITDGGGPVAVAGVMGGMDSEVTENTADILLEAANFHFISIRRTSAGLKIPSEAAVRFGRGVDPELTIPALRRASELMRELAGGTVAQGFADAYPNVPEPVVIDFRVAEVQRLLGISLPSEEVARLFESVGMCCEILAGDPGVVRTAVPSSRLDVTISADLVEEVARLYGYDRLPTTLIDDQVPAHARDMALEMEEFARDVLAGAGLTEVMTYSLTNLESVAELTPGGEPPDPESYVRLANPLTREMEYLRQTLMNTTLEAVARNLRFLDRVAIFEIAHVYLPVDGQALPAEPNRLSVALAGPRDQRSWLGDGGDEAGFYDIKGVVETLVARLGVDGVSYVPAKHPTFHPGRAAIIQLDGEEIGVVGEVHPLVRASYDLPDRRVCLAEIDLDRLLDRAVPVQRFAPISRMPALKMDLAIVVDQGTPVDSVESLLREVGGRLLVDVVLFDVFRGDQVGAGKESLAYSLTFQAPDKTLTTEQASRQRDRIVKRLESEFGAQIRG